MATNKKTFVPVVAVLNMKGGVGKTTLSANIFRVLFERRRASTLLLDLDPQFNLTQALFTRASYDKLKTEGKTILPVMEPPSSVGLFDIATSAMPPPAAATINYCFLYFTKIPSIVLDVVPGDFGLVKYSLMNDSKKLDSVRDRFLKFIEQEKANYKVICLDCNPSSSFLTLCALHACTHILVPVRPDRFSMLGLEILAEFVDSLDYLKKSELTGYCDEILDGIRATAVEASGCIALGLIRPAIFALRAQIDATVAWLYFKDPPKEWDYLIRTGEGFKSRGEIIEFLTKFVDKFGARFSILSAHKLRKVDQPYRLLSAHIHGQSTLVIPTFQKLEAMVYPEKQCKEAISLQLEVSEYVNDIFLSCFASKWPSLPDEIINSAKSRISSG